MHVYHHSFGRMQLKLASISITDNQYIVIIGLPQYNYEMVQNQIFLISGLLVVRHMFSYPKASNLINLLQSLKT